MSVPCISNKSRTYRTTLPPIYNSQNSQSIRSTPQILNKSFQNSNSVTLPLANQSTDSVSSSSSSSNSSNILILAIFDRVKESETRLKASSSANEWLLLTVKSFPFNRNLLIDKDKIKLPKSGFYFFDFCGLSNRELQSIRLKVTRNYIPIYDQMKTVNQMNACAQFFFDFEQNDICQIFVVKSSSPNNQHTKPTSKTDYKVPIMDDIVLRIFAGTK